MTFAFLVLMLLSVGTAIGVVAMRNPIHSALCLIGNLLTVAGIFAALDAHFLAVVQIIVYAGAIMVLVLFVLMLLNIKVENSPRGGTAYVAASVLIGAAFALFLVPAIGDLLEDARIPLSTSVSATPDFGTVKQIGRELFTKYLFPFEAASVLIMAAIVGAVMLAKRTRQAGEN